MANKIILSITVLLIFSLLNSCCENKHYEYHQEPQSKDTTDDEYTPMPIIVGGNVMFL